jgi:hypothetical protein
MQVELVHVQLNAVVIVVHHVTVKIHPNVGHVTVIVAVEQAIFEVRMKCIITMAMDHMIHSV